MQMTNLINLFHHVLKYYSSIHICLFSPFRALSPYGMYIWQVRIPTTYLETLLSECEDGKSFLPLYFLYPHTSNNYFMTSTC